MELNNKQKRRLAVMNIEQSRKDGMTRQTIIKNKKKSLEYNDHLLNLVEQGETIKQAQKKADKEVN